VAHITQHSRRPAAPTPEWAIWYAGHLQAHLGDRLGRRLTRSELTYLLIKAERTHAASRSAEPWNDYYARTIHDETATS